MQQSAPAIVGDILALQLPTVECSTCWFSVCKGVRQGSVVSSQLFIIHRHHHERSECITEIQGIRNISVRGANITELIYGDASFSTTPGELNNLVQ